MQKNASLELKKIDETKNYFLEWIKFNYLMNKNHKKVCMALNYFECFLIFISAVSVCVSVYAFTSLVGA